MIDEEFKNQRVLTDKIKSIIMEYDYASENPTLVAVQTLSGLLAHLIAGVMMKLETDSQKIAFLDSCLGVIRDSSKNIAEAELAK